MPNIQIPCTDIPVTGQAKVQNVGVEAFKSEKLGKYFTVNWETMEIQVLN